MELRYIGSKSNLLSEIRSAVSEFSPDGISFCDLFAGTGVVGREFKKSHQLVCNDILYFSYVMNAAYNGLSEAPRLETLRKNLGSDPIEFLNSLNVESDEISDLDFMTMSYSPAGPEKRQYLSTENALHIDRIRQFISQWHENGLINEGEFHYLLATVLESVPSFSNTTGTYGAYLKDWDKRALKPFRMEPIVITETKFINQIYNTDANSLIRNISGDVLYLDTPYNGRQYSSNYHLLESLARYDYPELRGKTGTRVDNIGSSNYCKKAMVFNSFDELLSNADFGTVLMSYSSDGLLDEAQLTELMTKHGKPGTLVFHKIPYRRYKRTSNDDRNVTEYLIGVKK